MIFTENEVIAFLDGRFLADHHAVINGSIYRWNPESHKLSVMLEDDDAIADACECYLSSMGRNFKSIDELVDYASKCGWPGWEKIKQQFDGTDDEVSAML
jgi:hypothetical protein